MTVVTLANYDVLEGIAFWNSHHQNTADQSTGRGVHLPLYDQPEGQDALTATALDQRKSETDVTPANGNTSDVELQASDDSNRPQRSSDIPIAQPVKSVGQQHSAIIDMSMLNSSTPDLAFCNDANLDEADDHQDAFSFASRAINFDDGWNSHFQWAAAYEPGLPVLPIEEEKEQLSKQQKKQERANARQVRKMLGKDYRTTKVGGFSLKPTFYGVRIGTQAVRNQLTGVTVGNGPKLVPDGFKAVSGFNLALYGQYYLPKNYRLQVDLALSKLVYNNDQDFSGRWSFAPDGFWSFDFDVQHMIFYEIHMALQRPLGQKGWIELGGFGGLVSSATTFAQEVNWSPFSLRPAPRYLYPRPFNETAYGVLVGYEYQISRRISASGRYYFGVNEVRNENFGILPLIQRASRFQYGLKFQLNKAKELSE